MPVVFATEPTGSRVALANGLHDLSFAQTPAARDHVAASGGAQTPPPLPVYFFPLDELVAGKDPRGGHPIAWMYLMVVGTQPVRTADVIPDPQGGFAFAAISAGQAAGTAQAIMVAENDPVIAGGTFELRLARVPALYVTALWLKDQKGKADHFVVISPAPEGFVPDKLIGADDFMKLLQLAAAQKARVTPPQAPNTATN